MIPQDWQFKQLGDIASVERGKFSVRPRNDPAYYGGEIPFVQTGDVSSSGKYLRGHSQSLNAKGLAVSKLFPKGTILLTIAANIGDTTIAGYDVAFPDSVVGILAIADRSDVDWLYYFLQTQKGALDECATQNAQKNINLEVLRPLKVATPPLAEQKRIAEILSTWDRAIETTEKLIANSEAQKKALMQQLLTGKKRLPGFDGEWEELPLTDAVKVSTGSSNREDSELEGPYTFFDRSTDIRRSARYLFDCEAVIVGGEGQEFIPKFFKGKFDLHQRAYAIHGFNGWCPKFIFYTVHHNRHLLLRYSVGSTVASLRMGSFSKIPVRAISLDEQKAISGTLWRADEEISMLTEDLKALRHEKSALMQQLLTGKRRVKVASEDKEAAA